MKKQNIFNIAIVTVALILVIIIGLYYLQTEHDSLTFSGPNIYRAVYAWEIMNEQGYEVNINFEGEWTDNNKPAKGTGIVLHGAEGAFLILYEDKEISVGGPTSGKEHIQAVSIILEPAHKSVVKIGLEPQRSESLENFIQTIESLSDAISDNIYTIGLEGDIMMDSETLLKPTIIQELDNILKGDNSITFYETGLRFSLKNANLADLAEIRDMFLLNEIQISNVATSRLVIINRVEDYPKKTELELVQCLPGETKTYSLRIIKKPIQ
jgi:hypothetical protein